MTLRRFGSGFDSRIIPSLSRSALQAKSRPGRIGGVTRNAAGAGAAALLAAGILSACTIEMITPTLQPTGTATPTPELPLSSLLPTIAGIATDTPTVPPTVTPDLLRPAEAGERIFYDPLDGNGSGWGLTKSDIGSVGFSGGMLVFTINTPYTVLVSVIPKEIPADAYIEVTLQTLLCGEGVDTFGIIFRRANENSYRYAATCFGQLHFERFEGFEMKGASDWVETLGLLQGAPATNRIGVLVRQNIFRFFVGGVEVFSRKDPMSGSGGVGLFIRTEKSNVLSVGFEELAVYALAESPK